ncbi:MAG: phosphatidylglycerol lysyltransferase domain-containing protein, partial [Oscillospiraceae bacterium]
VVHIEKAFADVDGAYPMINQQFVKSCDQDVVYINREDDVGSLGLRKSKLSYKPEILLKKYEVKIK